MTDERAAAPSPPVETGVLLDKDKRFSESVLWELNRRYYAAKGPAAWHSGEVPSYATCNTFIARSYALVVMSYLRDARAAGLLDPAQPVYVVELAAGVGRFAFQFLRKLKELKAESSLCDLDVRYVMTDFTATNPNVWRQHPSLAPLVDEGLLGFGMFDVDRDREIRLSTGGVLSAQTVHNPMVVIANYAFDTFRHDLFQFVDGKLCEVTISVRSPDPRPDLDRTEIITRLRTQYGAHPVDDRYYDDPAFNRVLAYYRERIAGVTFSMPYAGLLGLRSLFAIAGGRLLLLSSDKGYTQEDELYRPHQESMQFHTGCFSMMVNYHAIGRYFLDHGGRYAATARRTMNLRTVACMVGGSDAQFADTTSTIREVIESFGPGEFFDFLQAQRADRKAAMTIDHFLGLLRMSGWDPGLVWDYAPQLRAQAPSATEYAQWELRMAIERAWQNYYPGPQNLPFEIARILMAMRRPVEAIRYSHIAIERFGESPAALLNLGICHYYAENNQDALRSFDRALALNPNFGLAREWRARVAAEVAGLAIAGGAPAGPMSVGVSAPIGVSAPVGVSAPTGVSAPAAAPAPAAASTPTAAPEPAAAPAAPAPTAPAATTNGAPAATALAPTSPDDPPRLS